MLQVVTKVAISWSNPWADSTLELPIRNSHTSGIIFSFICIIMLNICVYNLIAVSFHSRLRSGHVECSLPGQVDLPHCHIPSLG